MAATRERILLMMHRAHRVLWRRGRLPGLEIDDLVQEAVVRWLARPGRVTEASEAVFPGIARRVWLESLAAAQRRHRHVRTAASSAAVGADDGSLVLSVDPDPGPSVHMDELRAQVEGVLGRFLEPSQVEMFVLVWLDGCSWRAAALRAGRVAADGEAGRRRFRRVLSGESGRRSLEMVLERFGIEVPNPEPRTPNPSVSDSSPQ